MLPHPTPAAGVCPIAALMAEVHPGLPFNASAANRSVIAPPCSVAGADVEYTGPLQGDLERQPFARKFPASRDVLHKTQREGAILQDQVAESSAELILILLRLDGVEVPLAVQNRVAEVLVDVAMKFVSAGLGDDACNGLVSNRSLGVERVVDYAEISSIASGVG